MHSEMHSATECGWQVQLEGYGWSGGIPIDGVGEQVFPFPKQHLVLWGVHE